MKIRKIRIGMIPLISRKAAKLDRRCNAILETARICAVNSSIIHPVVVPPTPTIKEILAVDFTTPKRRIVSLTYERRCQH